MTPLPRGTGSGPSNDAASWRVGAAGRSPRVAVALTLGVGVLRISPSPVGVAVALVALAVGVAIATWPIAGRTAEEWVPDVLRHAAAAGRGSRGAPGPFTGVRLIRVDPGPAGAGTGAGTPAGARAPGIGVLHDRSRRTFTAVMGASDPGFVLLGQDDKVRRVSAWSGVLASLARDGSAVHRVQWVERVGPAPAASVPTRFDLGGDAVTHDAARASYEALVDTEGSWAAHHQVLLAVNIHAGRAAAGGEERGRRRCRGVRRPAP